ncbi:MAG: FKBP-type peptidyl-prolyl cis-trans isomerase, partial [Candidatus Methanomethylophilaceae archaeon]|nr:FKBP-type peptidyl-prolyl cis-trans isomerase [Candidatus Methanomethylophilaceae archaeon]
MAAKNKNKGTKAKNPQVKADSEPVDVDMDVKIETKDSKDVVASREKAKGKESSGFMNYVRKSDPIILTCCVVLILAFAVVIGAYVNANFISPESDDRVVANGDKVEVEYVGSYFAFYDEEGAVIFDTNVKSAATNSEYAKSPTFKGGKYDPLVFTVGGSDVLKMFGDAVIGKKIGESVEVAIPADKGYGTADVKDFNTTVTISMANSMTLAEFNEFVDKSYDSDDLKGETVSTPFGLSVYAVYDEITGLVNYQYFNVEKTTEAKELTCDADVKFTITEVGTSSFTVKYEFSENNGMFLA